MKEYNRVCARIHLDAVVENVRNLHTLTKQGTKMIAVIKTDGYGHGAAEIGTELEKENYIWGFATATVEEACELRKQNITKPLLILGATFEDQFETMILHDIRPTVFELETAQKLSKIAQRLKKECRVHIKLDTGMNRIGMKVCQENAKQIKEISLLPNLTIEGMFTHFAKADETDKSATDLQIEKYVQMREFLKEEGIEIPIKHCSNTAGIIDVPEANMDLVRAGISIYGLWPSDEVHKENIDLKPALELKSHITYVKELQPSEQVSYGGTFTAKQPMRLATIPVGYGDGYPRSLSNKGVVLIRGQEAPICGRVCMDQFMVDVTHINGVCKGDEVTLVGKDGDRQITVERLADLSGRFNYEFVCDLTKRIPRVFYKDGKAVGVREYF